MTQDQIMACAVKCNSLKEKVWSTTSRTGDHYVVSLVQYSPRRWYVVARKRNRETGRHDQVYQSMKKRRKEDALEESAFVLGVLSNSVE